MSRIEKGIIVNSTIERVFNYIKDPSNWPEFWPSLIEISDIQPLPNGGYKARYEYNMAGMRFKGEGKYTEYIPNKCIVVSTNGGIISKLTFTFLTVNESSQIKKTRVTLTVEYNIPIPLLGKLAEVVISKMNEQDIGLCLSNLQARFLVNY